MITDICRQPGDGAGFGRNLDATCGSSGMFVQSARFVEEHRCELPEEFMIHGAEKTDETGRLCRVNLAAHGLEGDPARRDHGGNVNSCYDDPHDATRRFDFVLANPPFNVNAVDKELLACGSESSVNSPE